MPSKSKKVSENLRTIKILDLIYSTNNIIEKVFWIFIGIIGHLWLFYIITKQVQTWEENSTIITKGHLELSQIKDPAITVCSKSSPKYAIAERLGNYLDTEVEIPKEFRSLRNKFLLCATGLDDYLNKNWDEDDYLNSCLLNAKPKPGCKVIFSENKIIP